MKQRTAAFALLATLASGDSTDKAARTSSGRALGIYSRELPESLEAQAPAALAADARRRELRFRDAVTPGLLFASTRIEQREIDHGLVTPDELFQIGAQLFNHTFTTAEGFGARDLPPLGRFHRGRRGGPDARSCATCHSRGGPAGAGEGADNAYFDGDGDTQASAFERNPKSLVGAGYVEIAAREMTAELQRKARSLVREAKTTKSRVRVELTAKRTSFGFLSAAPDGSLDTSEVEGVDPDLVVRPFGWKGTFASIVDMVDESLLVHHGMQSDWLIEHAGKERIGAGPANDPDGDGVSHEITEGQVTSLASYIAMSEVPVQVPPLAHPEHLAMFAEGRIRFESLGCASCHTPWVTLESSTWEVSSRVSGATLRIDLARDGAEPRFAPASDGTLRLPLYSDLRRHDMGPELAEPRADRGAPGRMFMTPPLWGIARSRPYLHDGRAPDLDSAILHHGGEAKEARDAYAKLIDRDRGTVRLFLASLTRRARLVTR